MATISYEKKLNDSIILDETGIKFFFSYENILEHLKYSEDIYNRPDKQNYTKEFIKQRFIDLRNALREEFNQFFYEGIGKAFDTELEKLDLQLDEEISPSFSLKHEDYFSKETRFYAGNFFLLGADLHKYNMKLSLEITDHKDYALQKIVLIPVTKTENTVEEFTDEFVFESYELAKMFVEKYKLRNTQIMAIEHDEEGFDHAVQIENPFIIPVNRMGYAVFIPINFDNYFDRVRYYFELTCEDVLKEAKSFVIDTSQIDLPDLFRFLENNSNLDIIHEDIQVVLNEAMDRYFRK